MVMTSQREDELGTTVKASHKVLFWLLLIVPLMIAWYIYQIDRSVPLLKHSDASRLFSDKLDLKVLMRHYPIITRSLAFGLLIVALARPQSSMSWEDAVTEGIDIILALDISSSMLAEDLKPNRLKAAKKTATDFIAERPNDRIGLVVYAGETFSQCPLTIDHDVLMNLLAEIDFGMIDDGTAIGFGAEIVGNDLGIGAPVLALKADFTF